MNSINWQTRSGRFLLVCILAVMALYPAMSTDLYLPAFTDISKDFGIHSAALQITLAASFLGIGVSQPVWGPISDRYGRRLPAFIGTSLFIIGSILCAFAPNLGALSAARLLQALGGSASLLIGRAIVRDLYQGQEMARVLSAVSSMFMIGPILAPSLGALILHWQSWHWIFYSLAIFGGLGLFGIWLLPESLPRARRNTNGFKAAFAEYGRIIADHDFRFAALQIATNSLILFTYVASSPTVFMGVFQVSQAQFGFLFGINAVAILAGSQINRLVLKRMAVTNVLSRLVLWQFFAAGLLFALELMFHQLWILVVLLMLVTAVSPSVGGNATTLALANFKSNAAQAAAMVGVIQSAAAASIATVLTLVPGQAEPKMLTAIFIFAILAMTILQIRRREARKISA